MDTHTLRRHVKTLALRQHITKDNLLSITSYRLRFLSPILVRLFLLNLQLQLGEERMINLKARDFLPFPEGDIKLGHTEETLKTRFCSYGDTVRYVDPAKRFEAADGAFAPVGNYLSSKKLIWVPSR